MSDILKHRRGMVFWRQNWEDRPFEKGILGKNRPVLIVSSDVMNANLNHVIVVPLRSTGNDEEEDNALEQKTVSSRLEAMSAFSTVEIETGQVCCNQVYVELKSNLGDYVGALSDERMKEVDKCLKVVLGLECTCKVVGCTSPDLQTPNIGTYDRTPEGSTRSTTSLWNT